MMNKVKSICIYYANIFLWLFLKAFSIKKNAKRYNAILIIPPDSWTVWGSRGDEAMLEVVIDNYKKKGKQDFIIVVSSQVKKEIPTHENCRYYYKWYSHFPIFGFLKALKRFKPCEVVILGADCMDGYYSALNTLTRLICIDLCYNFAVPYNIVGFSFNQNPNNLLRLPYNLVSKRIDFKLRDPISLKRFESFTHRKATQVADSAFLLQPDGSLKELIDIESKIKNLRTNKGQFIVGFNFHPMLLNDVTTGNLNKVAVRISTLLLEIITRYPNVSFVIIPHDNRDSVSDCQILGLIADNLYKTLKDDITLFEKNALEKSVNTNNYKLGYITRMEMPSDDFANKIFADNKGNSLLEPIYANGLYYVVLVNGTRVPEKYTDINQDVLKREYFNANLPALLEAEKTKQAEILKSAAAGVNNLATLDGNGNIKYYRPAAAFSYNQGRLNTENGAIIPDSSTEAFYNNAFTLQLDTVSDVIKLDNGVAIMRVISDEKPDITRLATLDAATRNIMKKELSRQRVNDIVFEWGNQNISKARVKRHNIR